MFVVMMVVTKQREPPRLLNTMSTDRSETSERIHQTMESLQTEGANMEQTTHRTPTPESTKTEQSGAVSAGEDDDALQQVREQESENQRLEPVNVPSIHVRVLSAGVDTIYYCSDIKDSDWQVKRGTHRARK